MNTSKILLTLSAALVTLSAHAQTVSRHFLSDKHAMVSMKAQKHYLLLPVEEKEAESKIRVIKDGVVVDNINIKLATGKADYYVPLDLRALARATFCLI